MEESKQKKKKIKNQEKIILITMALNLLTFFIKLIGGIVFNFSTLLSDSIQSFIDFFTDIVCLIVSKIGKRRANKVYPFGYGQVYYIANIITSVLLLVIGLFIIFQLMLFNHEICPRPILFAIILITILLKSIVVYILKTYGKKYKSELILEAAKESGADLISSIIVLFVLILIIFNQKIKLNINIDKIGSALMAIYVFVTSLKMFVKNIKGMLTKDEENEELKQKILNTLKTYNEFKIKGVKVIKMATYYAVFLKLDVDDSLNIKNYILVEKQVKTHLKKKNKDIRYIDIEVV